MSGVARPNILILYTDQQRYDTINAAGYPHMITPNLDRLVNEGCLFRQACSPNPICVPTRHNLITGLPARYHGYAANNTHPLDHRFPTLQRILSDSGYETRAVGKMHFQPPRRHSGFDKMELMEEIPPYRREDEYAMYLKDVGLGHVQNIHGVRNLLYMVPQRSLIPEEHHGSKWVADRSIAFLKENGGKHPFFLWSSWIAPHPPFDIPESVADLYCDAELPDPIGVETPLTAQAIGSKQNADLGSDPAAMLRRVRECYFSAVTFVDRQVGRILRALEEIGQLDNTFIIFTSDHGEMLGDQGCFQKALPHDSASRVPFVVRWPKRVSAGSVQDGFVDANDILPTVLDVTGLTYPGPLELPGGSIFRDDTEREVQYMESNLGWRRWLSVRDAYYKFNYFYGESREELFDRRKDPGDTVNLLHSKPDDAEVCEIANRMRGLLVQWEQRWGLEGYVQDGKFREVEPHQSVTTIRRNNQFPIFPGNIADPHERGAMNDFGDEVIAAVAKEDVVRLHELDLERWHANGAPCELVERIRLEGL